MRAPSLESGRTRPGIHLYRQIEVSARNAANVRKRHPPQPPLGIGAIDRHRQFFENACSDTDSSRADLGCPVRSPGGMRCEATRVLLPRVLVLRTISDAWIRVNGKNIPCRFYRVCCRQKLTGSIVVSERHTMRRTVKLAVGLQAVVLNAHAQGGVGCGVPVPPCKKRSHDCKCGEKYLGGSAHSHDFD